MASIDGSGTSQPLQGPGPRATVVRVEPSAPAVTPRDQITLNNGQPGDAGALVAGYNALAIPMQQCLKSIANGRGKLQQAQAQGKPKEALLAKEALDICVLRGNNLLLKAAEIQRQLGHVAINASVMLYDSPTTKIAHRLTIATNNGANLAHDTQRPAIATNNGANLTNDTLTTREATRPYIIQPGDTLSAIAAKNHTTVAELVKLNGLANPNDIVTGDPLELPTAVKP
jgi:LysM repeat protein